MFLYFTHISLMSGAALLDSEQSERKKHRHKREAEPINMDSKRDRPRSRSIVYG